MKKPLSNFLKKTKSEIERLRDNIRQLKEEQRDQNRKLEEVPKTKEDKYERVVVHFSLASVAKATLLVILLIFFANFIKEIGSVLLIFFVSLLFAAALDPSVDWLQKKKIPRPLGLLLIYILMLGLLVFFFSQLVPLVAKQLVELAKTFSTLLTEVNTSKLPFPEVTKPLVDDLLKEIDPNVLSENLLNFSNELRGLAGDTLLAIKYVFNGVVNFIFVLIFTFFLSVEERGVDRFFISLFPSKHGAYIVSKITEIKRKVGDWLRGQVILMFVIFVISLIGYLILGLDNALTLAMIAGIAELIPVIGPLIAAIPAVLVGFNESYWLVLWVIGFVILIQQLEQHLVIPVVMKKAVGLSPIIVILAMMIGFQTLGVLGAIIAIPVTTIISIFVREYASKKK